MSSDNTRGRHPGPAQRVEPVRDLTHGAFGATVSVGLTTEVSAYTARAADDRVWKQFAKLTGSVAITDGEAALSTGATIYAYQVLQTRAQSAYLPGKGMRIAFTARFPTGDVTDCFQAVGSFHGEAGFAVGYPGDGTGFGFMHRRGRRFEVQALTVTVAATGNETVTLTLNGTAQAGIAVTAGSVQHNAKEIAEAATYSDSGGLVDYDAYAVDDVVYLIRQSHGPVAGAYTVSSTGDLDGTWAQFQAGATGTQTWVSQADWDDPCDGGGASGVTIDPQYLTAWIITYGWLGSLGPQLWVQDPRAQRFVPVHFLPWGGTSAATGPSVADPRFPIIYSVASLGSTTDVTIAGASCYIALENGDHVALGPNVSLSESQAIGTTEIPVVAIMVSPVDFANSTINRRRITIEELDVANSGAKDATVNVYRGTESNLVASVFTSSDDDDILLVDNSATAITGTLELIASFDVPAGTAKNGPLHAEGFVLFRGDVLIISASTAASTTTIIAGLAGHEDP